MSDSTIFREPVQQTPTAPAKSEVREGQIAGTTNVEVPYTEYEGEIKHPFPVDYYNLGEHWNDPDLFEEEVKIIDGFFRHLVETGKIDNTVKAVKIKLKEYEKIAGIKETDRTVMKVAKISAYLEFLKKTEHIERYGVKYGI